MLNRRILRIKVFKTLYSSVITGDSQTPVSVSDALAAFEESCESTRDLYLFMLGIVSPLTSLAAERIAAARNKIHPTEQDLNPNTKFADNALAKLLDSDVDFKKIYAKKKFSWSQYDIFLKKILNNISAKEYFKQYMESSDRSLAGDCKLFTRIFEEEFVDDEELEQILEDMSIYWNDDLAYSLTYCCRTFSLLAKGGTWRLPPLYQSDMIMQSDRPSPDVESDKVFSQKLLRYAIDSYPEYSAMVAGAVSGWEKDRLVTTDLCLVVCGLCEAVHFPSIPVRVSLNEYIEISKYYGTPKSGTFVNGILDRLIQKLSQEGKINKNE